MSEQHAVNVLPEHEFELTGGRLCLDFVNTLGGRAANKQSESLKDYRYLLLWSVQAEVVTKEEAPYMLEESLKHPQEAEQVLQHARDFREALYRLFTASIHPEHPAEDLTIFNEILASTQSHARLRLHTDHFQWGWDDQTLPLDRMLWNVARSAADLLTSDELSAVKTCGRSTCDWVFLDTSKNHSRRWCDMKTCGNRVKVRRYYQKKKQVMS